MADQQQPSETRQPIIKEIKTIELFDDRRYKFTFLNNAVRYIASVTTKLSEYKDEGLQEYRERVGSEEADRAMHEGGTWGSIVHHACFLIATGGAVLYEPPAFETVGIQNEEVAALVKQNHLIRFQFNARSIPHMTINDQFRFLQVKKFRYWLDVVKPEILLAETKVYSLAHDIAGRIDFLMRVKGGEFPIGGERDVVLPDGIILPDIKSGTWTRKHFYQLAAYDKAVTESQNIGPIVATVGIHLKAKTKSGLNTLVHLREEIDHDFTVYEHIAAIYDEKHANDTVDDYEFESVLLSDVAHDAVFLGGTIQNEAAETEMATGEIKNMERAAQFTEDLQNAKDVELPRSPAVKVNTDFLRRAPKGPRP